VGLFLIKDEPLVKSRRKTNQPSIETLHRHQCDVCPLAKGRCKHPQMPARGAKHPLMYILGEAPGAEEDEVGRQFVGASGSFLRENLAEEWFADPDGQRWKTPEIRWNNVVRTRPPGNRTPSWIEIECCRPSVEADIAAHKPKILITIGGTATSWAVGLDGITTWRGRYMPARIAGHNVWVFPMLHPAGLMRGGMSDLDIATFQRDIARIERLARDLPDADVETPDRYDEGVEIIDGTRPADFKWAIDAIDWYMTQRRVGIDLETTTREQQKHRQLRPYSIGAKIVSVALSVGRKRTTAIALHHPQAGWAKEQRETLMKRLGDLARNPTVEKIAQNAAFEIEWLAFFCGEDIPHASKWQDTQAQMFILDERRFGLSLDAITQTNMGFALKSLYDLDKQHMDQEPIADVLRYNALDAKYTTLCFYIMRRALRSEKMQHVYNAFIPRIPTMVATQLMGVSVDFEANAKLAHPLRTKIVSMEEKLQELDVVKQFTRDRRIKFNPKSNPHILTILRDFVRTPFIFTEDHRVTTDAEVLERVRHPFAKLLLDYREVTKLYSTYVVGIAEDGKYIYPDGKIHTVFNTMIARTGRTSSDNPNLQNFPKRTHKEIRAQIMARAAHRLLSVDYGQIEARVIAMASHDKFLCKALFENYDIHMVWAERLAYAYPKLVGGTAGIKDKDKMKTLRSDVKNQWVFPAFFGAQLHSIAGYMNVPEEILGPIFDDFWETFKGVRAWQEDLMQFYRDHGYVECLTGRRRHEPLYGNKIINTPIQGTASDIVVDAMTRISKRAHETGDRWLQPMMNIHDDLTFDVPEKTWERYMEIVVDEMLSVPFDFVNVPISIEVSVGPRWSEMVDLEKFSRTPEEMRAA